MHLTRKVAALAVLAALLPLASPGAVAVSLGDAAIVVLVALDIALAGSVRALTIERSGDSTVRLGSPATMTLLVTNTGRRPLRGVLRDAWEPSAGAHGVRLPLDLPPGERRRLTLDLLPTRRGDRRPVRTTVRTLGPLGLAGRQGRHDVPWRLRVLPPFSSRRFLPERLSRLKVIEGIVAARGFGRGTEVDGLRAYSEGDDVRSVDWRATARARDLIVRVHRPERDRRIILCIDSGRTAATRVGDTPRLDHAFDAALLVTALAERARDQVDLVVYDRRERGATASGSDALRRQADLMAPIEASLSESDHQVMAQSVLRRTRRRSLVVIFTDLATAPVTEGLLPVLTPLVARHTVLVAAVRDPDLAAMAQLPEPGAVARRLPAVWDAAAAQRTLVERERVANGLRRMGVVVVDAEAARFPAAVADAYLELKAAGRL